VVAKGWTDGRRKEASGEIKEKDARVGSFACTTRKRLRTKDDDDDLGKQVSAYGLKPQAESWSSFGGRAIDELEHRFATFDSSIPITARAGYYFFT
jgi:hypothetical protein